MYDVQYNMKEIERAAGRSNMNRLSSSLYPLPSFRTTLEVNIPWNVPKHLRNNILVSLLALEFVRCYYNITTTCNNSD